MAPSLQALTFDELRYVRCSSSPGTARRPPPPHTSPSPPRVPGTARAPPCSLRVIRLRIVGLERSADADAELSILNQVRGL